MIYLSISKTKLSKDNIYKIVFLKHIESVMNKLNSLMKNPRQPRRPQTPVAAHKLDYTPSNRSFNHVPGFNYTQQFPPQQSNNHPKGLTKSRVSVASSSSQLSFLNVDHGELFPEDIVFLLKNQEKNINNFKDKIEREKLKVENDFSVIRTQIQHILQDLKISVQAELDYLYKTFITKYAQIKGEVQEIRKFRKQILLSNRINSSNFQNSDLTSNKDIVNEIERDAQNFRNYKIYGYLSEVQKQRLAPVLEISTELILISSADCSFYRSKEMEIKMKQLKSLFGRSVSEVYSNINDFIITPQQILEREKKEQQQQQNEILKHVELEQQQQRLGSKVNFQPINTFLAPSMDLKKSKTELRPQRKSELERVSPSGGCAISKFGQSLNLKKIQRVVTDHKDAILCIFFINNTYIATGSKDKTINIYTLDGQKITTLRGHDASICCLSAVVNGYGKELLASGSDHGCCCLILWNTDSWTISSRIQSHSAAVTSIVDMEDGIHLVTGSYDKKINLFSHQKGEIILNLNNKSAVTSLAMSSDRKKLVSAGLDNSLIIWNIHRTHNVVQSLQIERVMPNASLICSLQASLLRPDAVVAVTRDGKIKAFNLSRGQLEKTFTVNENSLIELVVVERQMKSASPLVLSCSSKDKHLLLTKMDTGISESIRINGVFAVEFGCGIGPKIVMSSNRGGIMAILSQASQMREFSLYEMEIK